MRNKSNIGHRFKKIFFLFLSLTAISIFLYSPVVFARMGGFSGINNLTSGYAINTGSPGGSGFGMPMYMGGYMGGYTGGYGGMMLGGYGMGYGTGFSGNPANTADMFAGFGMGYGPASPPNTGFMSQYGSAFGNMYMNNMSGVGYGGTNNTADLYMNQLGNSNTYGNTNTNMHGMNFMNRLGMFSNSLDTYEYTDSSDSSRHMMGHTQGGMGSKYWGGYEFDSGTGSWNVGMPLPNAISSEGYMGYMSGMGTGASTFIPTENTAAYFGNWSPYY